MSPSTKSPEFISASHAAARLAAIVVPVSTRLAAPELAHILVHSGRSLLAFAPSEIGLATAVASPAPGVVLAAIGAAAGHPDLMAGGERDPTHGVRAAKSDDAFIVYTAGRRGYRKALQPIDHRRAVWASMAQIVSLRLRDDDRYLHLSPVNHSGGPTFLNATTR